MGHCYEWMKPGGGLSPTPLTPQKNNMVTLFFFKGPFLIERKNT